MTVIVLRRVLTGLFLSGCVALCGAARPRTPVTACVFCPDGSLLVVGHQDSVVVRSTTDGAERRVLPVKMARVNALAFANDGGLLAIAGGIPGVSGKVVLWDWKKESPVAEIGEFDDLATAVAFSPDGRRLGIASADKSAHVYRLLDKGVHVERIATLAGHAGPVLSLVFGPDGDGVVTASADRSLKVWEAAGGKLLHTLSNHTDVIHCVAARPAAPERDGASVNEQRAPWACASAADDKTVRIWQPEIGRMVRIVRRHDAPALAITYARDGKTLFSAGVEGKIRIIDADSDQVLFEWKGHDDWIYTLSTSPDGSRVASGDWAGNVRMWEVRSDVAKRAW
jgi:WD40 repeat protein